MPRSLMKSTALLIVALLTVPIEAFAQQKPRLSEEEKAVVEFGKKRLKEAEQARERWLKLRIGINGEVMAAYKRGEKALEGALGIVSLYTYAAEAVASETLIAVKYMADTVNRYGFNGGKDEASAIAAGFVGALYNDWDAARAAVQVGRPVPTDRIAARGQWQYWNRAAIVAALPAKQREQLDRRITEVQGLYKAELAREAAVLETYLAIRGLPAIAPRAEAWIASAERAVRMTASTADRNREAELGAAAILGLLAAAVVIAAMNDSSSAAAGQRLRDYNEKIRRNCFPPAVFVAGNDHTVANCIR